MSEAITKVTFFIILVVVFIIGLSIKEYFYVKDSGGSLLNPKFDYLDSLQSRYGIEFVKDDDGSEFAHFVEVFEDQKNILDRMPKSEYDKAVEKDLASFSYINPDFSQEDLEYSSGISIFFDRSHERIREAAQKEFETKAENNRKICVQKTDEALDLYYKIKNKEVEHVGSACDELSRLINEIELIKPRVYSCSRAIYGLPLECS